MIDPPEIIETPAERIAFIPVWVLREELRVAVAVGLEELSEALSEQGIRPTGPWLTRHVTRPASHFEMEICFPVSEIVKPTGRVIPGELRSATVARAIYTGPYSGLANAWSELNRWIQEAGNVPDADCWERYLAGPDSGLVAARFRTELNQPLKG